MLFRTATSVAILACAANVSAKPQPYKLAVMALPGMSLVRRDTNGYMPEETICGDGNTCEEACGGGYLQCASNDASAHCFNPDAGQNCCTDGTGNSCENGYYCTHDTTLQTWCCPDSMDLAECAAAYTVTGGLKTAESTTSSEPASTSSAAPTTTSTTSTSTTTTASSTSTSTSSEESTSSTPTPTSTPSWTPSVITPSSTPTSFFTANSTTVELPITSTADSTVPGETTTTSEEEPSATGAAAISGVSFSLLIAAAGVMALF